jgi:S-DNA-T family DNA segregation ATPase FtsK/SpoIIIE
MLDVTTVRRRAAEALRAQRPTLLAFSVAALGFVLAGLTLLTPDLARTTSGGTWVRSIARGFAIAFGPSVMILGLLAGTHAVLHLLGRGLRLTTARLLTGAALLVLVPCVFALLDGAQGSAGGVVGMLARDAVLVFLPRLFALPRFVLLTLFALVVFTDWLFQASCPVAAPVAARPRARPRLPVVAEEPEYEEEEEYDDEEEEEEEDEDEDEEYEEGEYEEEDEGEEEEEDEEEDEEEEEEEAEAEAEVAAPRRRRGRDKSPLPELDLLERAEAVDVGRIERAIQQNAQLLERTLASFRIDSRVVGYTRGPVITMYELALKEGTKLSQVVNRADDLAIALKAESVRIVAPIPGKNTVGVEVPNIIRDDVRLHGLLEESSTQVAKKAIPVFLGRDAAGYPMLEDLTKMPHLLIAGATGSGKSVCINAIITSILMTRRADEVRLILIDPKQVELAFFRDIPHLLTGIVTDPRKAAQTLEWLVTEMEDRYRIFALFGVRNITAYNRLGAKRIRELAKLNDVAEQSAPSYMPHLVLIVDELADLIMTGRKEVEYAVTRLAQKSRAVGIHSVLATQRPSTDVITGLIKANMPSRASFKVTSKVDSRVVLDRSGAEKLLGRGDMLMLPPRAFHLVRAQGAYVSDQEVKGIVEFLGQKGPGQELRELIVQRETVDKRDPREVDALFDSACRVVLDQQRGSASLLQRALSIGYTRASRLIDIMRGQGIVGEFKNAQAAEVLMTLEEYEEKYGAPPEP